MLKIIIYPAAAVCLFLSGKLNAQDPHFSQYFMAPSYINPALTGKDLDGWRTATMFRSQWWGGYTPPYKTSVASIEHGMKTGGSQESTLGLGVSVLNDASNSGLLRNTYATLNAAYNLTLDREGNRQLGVGLSGTYANRIFDLNKFEYNDQFGSMGYQRSVPTDDLPVIGRNGYFDVNAGVMYTEKIDRLTYSVGAAVFHAASPKQGVLNNSSYSLAARYCISGRVQKKLANENELHMSSLLDLQGSSSVYTLGVQYKYKTSHDVLQNVIAGLWKRFGDSFYPYIAVEGANWLVGLSYDVVTSRISNSYNSVQSLELSLACKFGKKSGPGKLLVF